MNWIVQDYISSWTLFLQYLCPCYLGLGAILIVLCGDIVHFTFVETSVTIAIMIIGITVYSASMANLTALVTNRDTKTFSRKARWAIIYFCRFSGSLNRSWIGGGKMGRTKLASLSAGLSLALGVSQIFLVILHDSLHVHYMQVMQR